MSGRSAAAKELLEYGVRYRFSEQSVFARGSRGTTEWQWNAFDGAVGFQDFYALQIALGSAWLIIPRTGFVSEDEDREFVDLVRRKLGKAARI
jgi:hypothetical protein